MQSPKKNPTDGEPPIRSREPRRGGEAHYVNVRSCECAGPLPFAVPEPRTAHHRGYTRSEASHPDAGVVGGGMGCGSARLINRAVTLSDFWRYQEPVPESISPFVSDANLAYRREVLQSLSDVWEDDFHETLVNGALLERGHQIWLTPAATIYQERGQLGWGEAGLAARGLNVSLGMLPVKADQELPEEWRDSRLQDRSRQVIVTCQTGENAARGGKLLQEMGFTNVSYMEGGMEAWKAAGLPTE